MSDPFAVALDALFASPMAIDAAYEAGDGSPVLPIRTIKSGPDRIARFGQAQVALASVAFEIRKTEVPQPGPGCRITVDGVTFAMPDHVGPISDVEGLTWTCWTDPVA